MADDYEIWSPKSDEYPLEKTHSKFKDKSIEEEEKVIQRCIFCGLAMHSRRFCPARNTICKFCGKRGHSQKFQIEKYLISHNPLTAKVQLLEPIIRSKDWNIRALQERAVMDSNIEALEILRDKGADLMFRDEDGWTLLHRAAECGASFVVSFLVGEGMNVDDSCSFWKRTPLHQAAENGHRTVVELLVALGASADIDDNWSRTPLHLAAKNGKLDVVSYLLSLQVPLNRRDGNGRTPLGLSTRHGHVAVSEMLSSKGGHL